MCPRTSPCLLWEVSFSICKMKRMPRHLSLAMLVPTVCGDVGFSPWQHAYRSLSGTPSSDHADSLCFVLLLSYLHIKTDLIFSILAPLTVPVRQARLLTKGCPHLALGTLVGQDTHKKFWAVTRLSELYSLLKVFILKFPKCSLFSYNSSFWIWSLTLLSDCWI